MASPTYRVTRSPFPILLRHPRRPSFESFDIAVNAGRTYDVSPDGRRFLMIKEGSNDPNVAPPTINVVLNWLDELKRLAPAK
jgi:hypothetical protein